MSDLLDTLKWKPWPKTPEWNYADIPGVARISTRDHVRYAVRGLEDGELTGEFNYSGLDRGSAVRILSEAIARSF